ncbi:MAG TPA: cytochrome c-type biogenesis protein CcmH [Trueperaceae bacterium]|nr:cytochrome c-type biogenesis protein CcmH [Trueperaceae bacterium]
MRKIIIALAVILSIYSISIAQNDIQNSQTNLDNKVFEISKELRCPVCVSESVADSAAEVSVNMRNKTKELLEQGKSKEEVLAYFQERYGDWILLNPPKKGIYLLVWLLPILAAIIGIVTLGFLVKKWLNKTKQKVILSQDDIALVQKALKEES